MNFLIRPENEKYKALYTNKGILLKNQFNKIEFKVVEVSAGTFKVESIEANSGGSTCMISIYRHDIGGW